MICFLLVWKNKPQSFFNLYSGKKFVGVDRCKINDVSLFSSAATHPDYSLWLWYIMEISLELRSSTFANICEFASHAIFHSNCNISVPLTKFIQHRASLDCKTLGGARSTYIINYRPLSNYTGYLAYDLTLQTRLTAFGKYRRTKSVAQPEWRKISIDHFVHTFPSKSIRA